MMQPSSYAARQFQPGIYRHYKGKNYRALGVGRIEATGEEVVIYIALYDEGTIWVRPLTNFCETVAWKGVDQPRFKLLPG